MILHLLHLMIMMLMKKLFLKNHLQSIKKNLYVRELDMVNINLLRFDNVAQHNLDNNHIHNLNRVKGRTSPIDR